MAEEEEWRPVAGFEGLYEVSSLGRVRSLDHTISRRSRWGHIVEVAYKGKVLRPGSDKSTGYPTVRLCRCGIASTAKVHVLVCAAFHGARPDGAQVAHGNGIATDVRASNLRWDTPTGNSADKMVHGTQPLGENCAPAKLIESQVRQIRQCPNVSASRLAGFYSVSASCIRHVRARRTWRHI